jgi:prepilin-type N-terminal cleavage/methylation domain-containing protein
MRNNGFTLIEVLISLSVLGIVMTCCFVTQREYQVLAIQAHHFQEQQEQFTQLREIMESCRFNPASRAVAISQWRKSLPKYMANSTLTGSGNNQLMLNLCSAPPTKCISEKIVV